MPEKISGITERFFRYVKIDTQSNPASDTWPSTQKQLDLARLLVQELKSMGLVDVTLDENGYVMACLPSNLNHPAPVVGLIAHMDTSNEVTDTDVQPRLVENYTGGDVVLNEKMGIVLSPRDFPDLEKSVGEDLVVTDGTTLLGADDKAGVTAIMTALDILVCEPGRPHGEVRIGFTPDEEIGRGANRFNIQKFGADLAFTIDGGEAGEINFETFNAAWGEVFIHGRVVHPGSAKGIMVNSISIGEEFDAMLPRAERPEHTEGYEGYYHLMNFKGSVEETKLRYLIRDHDRDRFDARKKVMRTAADFLNGKYGDGTLRLEIADSYPNMGDILEKHPDILDIALQATRDIGIEPKVVPIRGGTDGARLTEKGLPTPNLFTGGMNYHSRYEYASVQGMEKSVQVILRILELYAEKG